MDMKKTSENYANGILPALAPLANPYVPFQMESAVKYAPQKAIIRGTLYPGLDLPFMGMVNKNNLPATLMSDMQTLGFVIQELALYLDTHRDDHEALLLYRQYQKAYAEKKDEYEKKHGPLSHECISNSRNYEWLDEPWPWEYAKNKEV